MKTYTKKEKIKYLDVDKNNKLTNRAIINLMQNVAGEHANINGDGLKDQEKTGFAWLILNWKIQVFARPHYEEELEIKTWVNKMELCCSWREFEIYCNNTLVAKGESRWVLTNTKNSKIIKIPEEIIKKYAQKPDKVFEDELKEKISEPKELELTYEETIGRTKLDTNNHLNNLYYLDLAVESLPEDIYETTEFNKVEIMYKKQVKYREKIKCFYGVEENSHKVVIKSEDEKNIKAIVEFYN